MDILNPPQIRQTPHCIEFVPFISNSIPSTACIHSPYQPTTMAPTTDKPVRRRRPHTHPNRYRPPPTYTIKSLFTISGIGDTEDHLRIQEYAVFKNILRFKYKPTFYTLKHLRPRPLAPRRTFTPLNSPPSSLRLPARNQPRRPARLLQLFKQTTATTKFCFEKEREEQADNNYEKSYRDTSYQSFAT